MYPASVYCFHANNSFVLGLCDIFTFLTETNLPNVADISKVSIFLYVFYFFIDLRCSPSPPRCPVNHIHCRRIINLNCLSLSNQFGEPGLSFECFQQRCDVQWVFRNCSMTVRCTQPSNRYTTPSAVELAATLLKETDAKTILLLHPEFDASLLPYYVRLCVRESIGFNSAYLLLSRCCLLQNRQIQHFLDDRGQLVSQ